MSSEHLSKVTSSIPPAQALAPDLGRVRAQRAALDDWDRTTPDSARLVLHSIESPWSGRARDAREETARQAPAAVPPPPVEWAAITHFLSGLGRSPVPPPSWWKAHQHYRASLETHTDPASYGLDDRTADLNAEAAPVTLQLTLAGWGHFHPPGQPPAEVGPGKAFLTADSTGATHSLPAESPGWTFVRVEVHHPYLKARLLAQISAAGPLVEFRPFDELTASALRLVRGALLKDFRDQYDAELALFGFVASLERWATSTLEGAREAERLMDEVRQQVLARLPSAIEVSSLAKRFGMSRSHFSHLFHERTGVTPAHFATEVRIQEVEQMLRDTREPLKTIAAACGFANANHLCKVFRRLRHYTPTAFRLAFRSPSASLLLPGVPAGALDRGAALPRAQSA